MSSDRDLLAARGGFNGCVLGREGYVVYNRNDLYVGRAVERYGEYGEIEARLLRQACPAGAVAVEVGANLGTHTLVLARSAGPAGFVYAYEPQRVVFQCLCANLAVNSTMNVDARHAAVGSEAGFVLMPDIDYSREANFGSVSANAFSEGRKVRRVRLDDDLDLGRLDLLKIDVEGMESEVIAGGTQLIERLRPVLYVENDRVEHSEALIRQIMQLDYRLYWHMPPLFNEDNYFGERENIYSNIVSVNMLCVPRSRPQVLNGFQEILDPGEHPMRGTPGS